MYLAVYNVIPVNKFTSSSRDHEASILYHLYRSSRSIRSMAESTRTALLKTPALLVDASPRRQLTRSTEGCTTLRPASRDSPSSTFLLSTTGSTARFKKRETQLAVFTFFWLCFSSNAPTPVKFILL